MTVENDICECAMFDFGDMVRSRQNPHLTGQVIGERNWGDEYMVRLADGASTIWWHAIEIEHDGYTPTPTPVYSDNVNVVRANFAKLGSLTSKTTTKGNS